MELRPCPFCGSKAEIERVGDARQSTIYACTQCGCRLETGEEWGHGRRWNQRYEPKPELCIPQSK
jgi:Lar family restriction alleviation protein